MVGAILAEETAIPTQVRPNVHDNGDLVQTALYDRVVKRVGAERHIVHRTGTGKSLNIDGSCPELTAWQRIGVVLLNPRKTNLLQSSKATS